MDELAVVRFGQGWRIFCEGSWCGCFEDEAAAVQDALRLASRRWARGRDTRVVVQDRNGELLPLWRAPGAARPEPTS